MKKLLLILFFLILVSGCVQKYDADNLPRFVKQDYIELDKVTSISKFRSGAGHDFSDPSEDCRSMKHYYEPYDEFKDNNQVKLFSPVDGVIVEMGNAGFGSSDGLSNKQVRIESTEYPGIVFILFHVDLTSGQIKVGKEVTAGEHLGYARLYIPEYDMRAHDTDIGVGIYSSLGVRFVSFFDVMDDTLFQDYIDRGIESRDDFKISKEERDNNPLLCNGEEFLNKDTPDDWVDLNNVI